MARSDLIAQKTAQKLGSICKMRDKLQLFLHQCRVQKLHLFTAESCTGGMLASQITSFPGVSAVYHGGVVCYSNQSKIDLLKVAPELLDQFGAVSSQVAEALVQGALQQENVDLAISITGIAGPSGGSATKPVGLVFLAVGTKKNKQITITSQQEQFAGSRYQIQTASCEAAVNLLLREIES